MSSDDFAHCPECGEDCTVEDKFCGHCGFDLRAGGRVLSKSTSRDLRPFGAVAGLTDHAPQENATTSGDASGKAAAGSWREEPSTAESLEDSAAMQRPSPDVKRSQTGPSNQPKATMLGLPKAESRKASSPAKRPAQARGGESTMLGMASPVKKEGGDASAASSQGSGRPSNAPSMTMLGMPAAGVTRGNDDTVDSAATRSAFGSGKGRAGPPPQTDRTMLGAVAPAGVFGATDGAPAAESEGRRSSAPPTFDAADDSGDSAWADAVASGEHSTRGVAAEISRDVPIASIIQPKPKLRGALLVVFLLLLTGLIAFGVYFAVRSTDLAVDVRVVSAEGAETLEVVVHEAADGMKVRFQGEEAELEAGRARLPLGADALQLGENRLDIELVDAGGHVESQTVVLQLSYRLRTDLTALTADPPAVVVVVDALPGFEVELSGQRLVMGEHGHAERSFPLPASDDGEAFELTVRYRVVTPQGDSEEGQVRAEVPYATLEIDRPGESVTTEQETIEIAGIARAEQITLNGQPLEVRDGRFFQRVPLSEIRSYEFELVAVERGKAPRKRTIRVTRVESLAEAASGYPVDANLTYARIEQNPNSYRGQKVRFEGQAYSVRVERGRSTIQMLVSDCPDGHRCPLWVEYPAAAEVEVRQTIQVYGEVTGQQPFRARGSQRVVTVPRVEAAFIVPTGR